MSADSVEPVSQLLRDNFQVVRYNQQGSTEIEPGAGSVTVEQLLGQIEAVCQWLGEDNVALLGHSWGAGLAALYADAYPEHVVALVLAHPMEIASHQMVVSQKELERRRPRKDRKREWEILRELRCLPVSSSRRDELESQLLLLDFRLTCADQPAGRVLDGLPLGPFDWRAAEMLWNDLEKRWPGAEPGSYDLSSVFGRLPVPALVITGDQDVIDPQSTQRISQLSQTRSICLPESGHWSFLEQPQPFKNAVCEFLNSLVNEDKSAWKTTHRPLKALAAGSR